MVAEPAIVVPELRPELAEGLVEGPVEGAEPVVAPLVQEDAATPETPKPHKGIFALAAVLFAAVGAGTIIFKKRNNKKEEERS